MRRRIARPRSRNGRRPSRERTAHAKRKPGVSNKHCVAHEPRDGPSQTDPLIAAVSAGTIATALALSHGLPSVLDQRNWARRRDGLARAHRAISRALRADLRSRLSPEELATLEAAKDRLARLISSGRIVPFNRCRAAADQPDRRLRSAPAPPPGPCRALGRARTADCRAPRP
jgi:hypothetical protein